MFRPLAEREIGDYVATGEPLDKAGGYAYQGGARRFVSSLEGDADTVDCEAETTAVQATENGAVAVPPPGTATVWVFPPLTVQFAATSPSVTV